MDKSGFTLDNSKLENNIMEASFGVKLKGGQKYCGTTKTIDISLSDESKCFTLSTSSSEQYFNDIKSLIKSGFFYDKSKDFSKEPAMLFQKANITVQASTHQQDGALQYCFKLRVKRIPSTVKYAEDLLLFDSHELLVSFFGEKNVKKDMYYFSETELRKCSVLFSGTKYQVVFIWKDELNFNDISYILIPHVLSTAGVENNNSFKENNEWQFKNGIYPGMDLKELLRLNEMDFDIYGNTSELALMVKPAENGKIDFKKTAVTLSCSSCNDIKIFDKQLVSALDVAKRDLPMYVNDVIIYPTH